MNHKTKRGATVVAVAIGIMALMFCAVGYVYIASQVHWWPFAPLTLPTGTAGFPSSPTVGQTYAYNGVTYTWNGNQWVTASGTPVTSFNGPITVNTPFYIFNQTVVTAAATLPTEELLHSPGISPGMSTIPATAAVIGIRPATSNGITGQLLPSDNGIAYLLVGPNGQTTYGLLYGLVATTNVGIISGSATLVTYQGYMWGMYQLSLTPQNLGSSSLSGLTSGTCTVNIYGYVSETPSLTSNQNTTALTTTSYTTISFPSDYLGGLASPYYGQGCKITRMTFTPYNSTYASYFDNSYIQVKAVTVNWGNGVTGTYTQTAITLNNGANDLIEVQAGPGSAYLDGPTMNVEFNAIPWICGQADSPTTLTITPTFYGQMPNANTLLITLTVYYITPAGVVSSATSAISIT
jgi:hypothetical protein